MKRSRDFAHINDDDDDDDFHPKYCHTPLREIPTRASIRRKEQAKETWLDELQPEIRARIALHVNNDPVIYQDPHTPKKSTFALAEVSEKQRLSVAEALSFKFHYEEHHSWSAGYLGYDANIKWARVIRGCVRHVDFDTRAPCDLQYLLKEPTLRSVQVSNRPRLLKILAQATQLRELSLLLTSNSNFRHVSTVLGKLHLTKLRLECARWSAHWRGMCMQNVLHNATNYAQLRAAKSKITTLEVVCRCNRYPSHLFTSFLSAFTALRKLLFNLELSEEIIPVLQRLESVVCRSTYGFCESWGTWQQLQYACKIGHAVTGIEIVEAYHSHFFRALKAHEYDEVKPLGNCPRLQSLAMRLQPGAENAFPELHELEHLDLCWKSIDRRYQVVNRSTLPVMEYHAPTPSFFSRLLQNSPNIKELRLFKIRISMETIVDILETYNKELRVFGISVYAEDKPPHEHVLSILHAVRRYAPNLRRLDLLDTKSHHPVLSEHRTGAWRNRITQAVCILRRAMPQLDIACLGKCLNDILQDHFPICHDRHGNVVVSPICPWWCSENVAGHDADEDMLLFGE